MVVFNYSTRELTTKVVYYGPGLCGKTTNLQFIYDHMPEGVRGKMLSLATKSDRTLFFDFLPIDLGQIQGMKSKVQLYTVPGQVFYNETRRLVLKGADGVVFVADSQASMIDANLESFQNLEENLRAHGMNLAEAPLVLQFNKQDLPDALPVEVLNEKLNKYNAPFYEAIATTGVGVQETLKHITKLVLLRLADRYSGEEGRARVSAAAKAEAASSRPPAPPLEMAAVSVERPAAKQAAAAEAPPAPSLDLSLDDDILAAPAQADAPPPALRALGPDAPAPPSAAAGRETSGPALLDDDILGVGLPSSAAIGATQKINLDDLDAVLTPPPAPTPAPVVATPEPAPALEDGPFFSAVAAASAVEVAPDDALLHEEGLEVTRLEPGEAQEILIPLQTPTPTGDRFYRLVIRLELRP